MIKKNCGFFKLNFTYSEIRGESLVKHNCKLGKSFERHSIDFAKEVQIKKKLKSQIGPFPKPELIQVY